MNNKIITGVLTIGLMISSGSYVVKYAEVSNLNNIVKEQRDSLKEKSAEIANLENVIEEKDINLQIKESAIENYVIEVNDLKESNANLEKQNKELKTAIEKANAKQASANKVSTSNTKATSNVSGNEKAVKTLTVNASAYTSKCNGCTGITASGHNVKNTIYYNGMRIIATDNSVIPMYSIVRIEGFNEKFIVLDRGGAIKGNKIDILFSNKSDAYKFGRKNLKLEVIRYGK